MSELNNRVSTVDIEPVFLNRWSPRSLTGPNLSDLEVQKLFEAARWAPSCFNDQPWRFVYGQDLEKARLTPIINEANQVWAKNAPLLVFVIANNNFRHNNKPNNMAQFDAGAAWMSLVIQAMSMGLYCHAMAGIDRDKGKEILNLREGQTLLCAIAIGRKGDSSELPENLQEKEKPSQRLPLEELVFVGKMPDND